MASVGVTGCADRFSMSVRASSLRDSVAEAVSSLTTVIKGCAVRLACLASSVLMTAPNSVLTVLNSFSFAEGLVSRVLVLEGRAEMSRGVRIMGFTLERVG